MNKGASESPAQALTPTDEKVPSDSQNPKLMRSGLKLFIVTSILSVVLFTSCIIAGIVVALLRNDLTNFASDYALKHVLVPLLALFAASVVLVIFAYFRHRKLNFKAENQDNVDDTEAKPEGDSGTP